MSWNISSPNGIISGDYLDLENSNAIGGATFYAGEHSIDDGGNTGWLWSNPLPPNRYWVGGTGNWSDAEHHWATESGGEPSVDNLPTELFNVIIDANSGFENGGELTLDTGQPVCKDFTSMSGHTYTLIYGNVDDDLYIYGSVQFEAGLIFDPITYPYVVLRGIGNHIITINGSNVQEFHVFGSGTFILLDELIIEYTFKIVGYGTFDANDNDITAQNFVFQNDNGSVTIYMGSGTWKVAGNEQQYSWLSWEVVQDEYYGFVNIIPETSTIRFVDINNNIKNFSFTDFGGVEQGKIFNNIWFDGGGILRIWGSNTFKDFKINKGLTVDFAYDRRQTIETFTAVGDSENIIILQGFESVSSGLPG